jgi:exosortase/archaeosortase family protein
MDIEVAKECSGIRSSLSLIITALLAGHFFLRTGWSRALLVLAIVPITILKNGFRIAMLSILGVYVDERILGSDLHRKGGILFFIMALVLVWGVIALLRKSEGKPEKQL